MSAELSITEVDPFDDDLLGRWHAVQAASQRHGRGDTATVWTLPEVTVMFREPTERRWRGLYAAVRAGDVVGTGLLVGSLVDNLDTLEIGVDVHPDHRGAGIGTALLDHLEQVARDRGRRVLHAEVAWSWTADPHGVGEPSAEFARTRGYALGLVDVQRRLPLPVDAGLLDRLGAETAPHHAAYDVRAWSGPVPDDLVDGWAALMGSLMTEAPTGEMEREDEAVDAAAVREGEALIAKQGRTRYNAVALDAGGEVVAYSDLVTTVHEPGRAYQWGTLVRRDHRGHRLGMAVKLANLRLLQAERGDITSVRTWNAEVNAHMVGVNAALGFEPVERMGELQKRL